MPIPVPRCDRARRLRCRWYIASLTGLPAFLELTVPYPNKTPSFRPGEIVCRELRKFNV
jgi:hypothetical protein